MAADLLLKENIFENKENCKDIEDRADILMLFADEIDDNIRDNTDGDSLGNTVEQRHGYNAEICRNSGCIVVLTEFDLSDVAEHQESNDDKRRCCCE